MAVSKLWIVMAVAVVSLAWQAPADAKPQGRKAAAQKAVPQKAAPQRATASSRAAAKGRVATKATRARPAPRAVVIPAAPSVGQISGLHGSDDPLSLKSSVALVVDQDTNQVLFSKNSDAVLPIASITKLMTALVVVEAGQRMDEVVSIGQDDLDLTAANRSRLALGTELPRGEMLRLALMSSENRAASALSRHYPGGAEAFVAAMNRKAAALGMHDTRYVEPTGLSSDNRSSANDLSLLVKAAYGHDLIRELSTSRDAQVAVGSRQVQFHNTNLLVGNPTWEIGLQKTGYIAAAGRCLVMQAQLAGRKLIMVFLDSAGKYSRIGDAERVRSWLTASALEHKTVSVSSPAQAVVR